MRVSRRVAFVVVLAIGWSTPGKADSEPSAVEHFDQVIAPLLASRCLNCHSGADPKGKLDLTSFERVKTGGDSGAALVPGDVESSLLWQKVRDDEMPPEHPLSAPERQILRNWI